VFLSIGWIVFYLNTITKNSAAVVVASVASFLATICLHVATVAGSLLEAQSVRLQASVRPVGTLVPLPTLWLLNGTRILAPQLIAKKTAILQPAYMDLNIKNKLSVTGGAKDIEFRKIS